MPQSGWAPGRPAQLPPVAAAQRPLPPVPSLSFWLSGCCSEWLDCATLMGHPRQQAAQQVRRAGQGAVLAPHVPAAGRAVQPQPHTSSSTSAAASKHRSSSSRLLSTSARRGSVCWGEWEGVGGRPKAAARGTTRQPVHGAPTLHGVRAAQRPCTACPRHTYIHQAPQLQPLPPHLLHKQRQLAPHRRLPGRLQPPALSLDRGRIAPVPPPGCRQLRCRFTLVVLLR